MNPQREIPMQRLSYLAMAVVGVVAVGGCNLDVENPNAPDAPRAFVDPAGLQQLLGGAFRTWVETRGDYFGVLAMTAMADNYTASWNNGAIRFYSSVASDCPSRCGWTNSATAGEAQGGPSVESQWYGYYNVLSSANDVLRGIADGICFDNDCSVDSTLTSRNKTIAKMLQGMALAGIALNYDQGFAVDETVDLPVDPTAYPAFVTRQQVRDMALQKFEDGFAEAGVTPWSTPVEWTGGGNSYTNLQIRQLIRTMQAELLALFPRNAAENGTEVNWAAVATYASQGISTGAPFDWEFFIDVTGRECGLDCVKTWGNSIGTMRVDTRLAALLTNGEHLDPWPEPDGNECPISPPSPDRRVGDGSWGESDDFNGYSTVAATPDSGTDFACSGVAIFTPARGQYHQSNLQHVRYSRLAYRGENLPDEDGTGSDPFYTRQMNDLLWAEGLLRQPTPDPVLAAAKINNSRVGRGGAGCATPGVGGCGLVPLTGTEGIPALLAALQYEQEIEFMGQGPTPFFNRRRSGYNAPAAGGRPAYVDGLIPGTPRHQPVPAREMFVLAREIYTFGGPSLPDMSTTVSGDRDGIRSVREIYNDYRALRRLLASRKS